MKRGLLVLAAALTLTVGFAVEAQAAQVWCFNYNPCNGTDGFDIIYGTFDFPNEINGWGSADTIYGYSGNDTLRGQGGGDTLRGASGNDTLIGGTGADSLIGADGYDTCDGGDGADSFSGCDRIIG